MEGLIRERQILALAEVLSDTPSPEYALRRIFRAYSERFHTPLHMVDDIPLVDVLTHYYETVFEQMSEGDEAAQTELEELTKTLSMSEQEAEKARAEKAKRQYRDYLFEEELKREAAAQGKPKAQEVLKKTEELIHALKNEEIKMQFVSDEEMDELSNQDGVGSLLDL
jgi:primosomal protein N'